MGSQSRSTSSTSPSSVPNLFLPPAKPSPSPTADPSSSSPSSDPTTEATSSPTTDLPTDDWSADDVDGETTDSPDHDGSSSHPSSGEVPKGSLASRAELRKVAAAGVVTVTNFAHETFADEDGKAVGLYLADQEEVDTVADAAAGLISRRVPPGVGSPDATDIVRLALALVGYGARQFMLRRELRRARMGQILGGQGDVDEPREHPAAA